MVAKPNLNMNRCLALMLSSMAMTTAIAEPFSLTASHTVLRDSNFARTETAIADTINTTALQLGFDKAYGRQTYAAKAKVAAVRFGDYSSLDSDEKDVSAGFSSELLANWRLSLNGAYGENLNQFENNNAAEQRIVRNIRTTKSAQAQLVYGISGLWALVGSAGKNTLAYSSSAYNYLNYSQNSVGLKAVYYSTDLLNYSVGVRKEEADYYNQGELIDEWNVDFSTDWKVSGLSTLGATLSWTQSERQSRPGAAITGRNYNGLTGYLNWNYTPGGMLSYGLSMYKTSNADQFSQRYLSLGSTSASVETAQLSFNNRVFSTTAFAKLTATPKTSFTASTTWSHFNVERTGLSSIDANDSSDYRNYAINANYMFDRWLRFSAGVNRYSQTKDVTRRAYSGHGVNLSASVLLD